MLDLDSLASGLPQAENQAGGLRLQYYGKKRAIMATGGLVDEAIGYSTDIPFWSHDLDPNSPAVPITYASVGLMVGQPNPGMGFPASLRFTPHAVLENTTAQPLTVTPTLNYMPGGSPVTVPLPVQQLQPLETRQLDLASMLAKLGLGGLNGDVNLTFSITGHGADLLIATESVDQTGNFVFPVPAEPIGQSFGKGIGHWTVANGVDTMYSLWNPTNTDQDFVVTLHYGDGSGQYVMPLHLAAQASTTIDIAMLIAMRQPNANGNLIPNYIQEGSVVFSNPKGRTQWMTLAVCGAFYNPRKATCGPYWTYCYGYCDFEVEADPFSVAVGGTVQLKAQATYGDGSVDTFTTSSSWSSNNTSVATVGASTGLVTGVSPGSLQVECEFPSLVEYTGEICVTGGLPIPCPVGAPTPFLPGTVITVSQSPSSFNMSTGDTDQITVTVAPSSLQFTASFGSSRYENPYSSCGASLNIPNAAGTGSATANVTASPKGCSGAFSVVASVGGVGANSPTTVYVPPQVLIQMMQAEAGGTLNSTLMQGLGDVATNRIESALFYNIPNGSNTNYQNTITDGQFATTSTPNGILPELNLSVNVFLSAGGAFCDALAFWTPTAPQWSVVQAAWQSGTTTFPSGTGAPTYLSSQWATSNQQIIYASNVGTQSNGAPNFLFLGWRSPSNVAVASGACSP